VVIEMVDADSVKWRELAGKTGPPLGWIYRREAATLEPFERRAMRAAFATTAVNDRERDALLSIAPEPGRGVTFGDRRQFFPPAAFGAASIGGGRVLRRDGLRAECRSCGVARRRRVATGETGRGLRPR
jgi:hypothetical protein